MNTAYTTTRIHISLLKVGDTALHCGELVTVSRSNLKRGGLMGRTLMGDSYHLGAKPVTLVNFPRFYRGVSTGEAQ